MPNQIRGVGTETENITLACLSKTKLILQHAHESPRSILKAFDRARRARGGSRGGTTDEEQDLLRSMLVLSAAGLDSMIKQIIRDCLVTLAEKDEKVRQGIETFVTRRIKTTEEDSFSTQTVKFLASILVSDSPKKKILEEYINSLTGGSLQSPEELIRAVYALGLEPNACSIDNTACKRIFDIRNKIIHELDINFDAPRRRRHVRRRDDMIEYTNHLLSIGEMILMNTYNKIR